MFLAAICSRRYLNIVASRHRGIAAVLVCVWPPAGIPLFSLARLI